MSTEVQPRPEQRFPRKSQKSTVRETLPWGDFLVAFVVKAVEPDQGGPIRPTRVISSRIDNEKTHFQAMETARIVDAGWAPR